MGEWGEDILADEDGLDNGWRQPYVVLSYCRMLHTLQTGRVESKRARRDGEAEGADPKELIASLAVSRGSVGGSIAARRADPPSASTEHREALRQ